jgi:mannose-6-phosphate isomerase-like protein (cupin superfamily)
MSRVHVIDGSVLETAQRASGKAYHEFLRVPSLSVGIYRLPAGAADAQRPHAEDEVYHVMSGRARFAAGGELRDVGPGTVIFVAGGEPHHFVDIAEELVLLVFFAPPEGST